MRTRSGSRWGWAAAAVVVLAATAPEVAHAQQGGLFPLAPIRRERVPCPAEDPVYRLYRHEYFGYHPTCWRKFPAGWGCPNPEAPNEAREFSLLPRTKPPADENDANPEGDKPDKDAQPDMPARGNSGDKPNQIPPLPPSSNPFDLDAPPTGRGAGTGAGGAVNPSAPPTGDTPATTPTANPPAGETAPPPPGTGAAVLPPVTEPPATPGTLEPPVLDVREPNASVPPPPAVLGAVVADGSGRPLAPAVGPYNGPMIPARPAPVRVDPNASGPFQAPRRTGLLGGLLSGGLFRR